MPLRSTQTIGVFAALVLPLHGAVLLLVLVLHPFSPSFSPSSSLPSPSSVPSFVQRAFLVFVPAGILLVVAISAVWGEAGLLSRYELRERLAREKEELARIERDNQRLLSELLWLDRDPVLLERAVAEELGWAREGTTLYRFAPESDPEP